MITILITMGGAGSRFRKAGITTPKYLLNARGADAFAWSLSSLPLHLADQVVFVGLDEHRLEHDVEALARQRLPGGCQARFVWLPSVTRGQAESALLAEPLIPRDSQLLIFNIDTWFRSATLDLRLIGLAPRFDGFLGAALMPGDNWSFALTGETGRVTQTSEKRRISDHALTGLYHFSVAGQFFDAARHAITENTTTHGEFFVAPLYNLLISQGGHFVLDAATLFAPIGTPAELDAFNAGSHEFIYARQ